MGYWRRQPDMAHALSPDFGPGDFNSATVADDAPVPDPLVLPAEALPVLGGTEEALAKKSVFFRPQRTVVNGFRLGYLAMRPVHDLFWGSY
jgi:hypothetical protein